MTSKIKIKMGAIEIEYEGSESFLKEELPALLTAVSDLYKSSAPLIEASNLAPETTAQSITTKKIEGTTATLAAKLGGSTGPDLLMSAAARLHFVLGKERFHKKELSDEIKSANNYFKTSYASNLVSLLSGLVKSGRLMEPSKDNYSLSVDSLKNIGSQLA
jgi:hypothetical protein